MAHDVALAPTCFSEASASRLRVVVASTFDLLSLHGPLQVWLRKIVGFTAAAVQWVGYGLALEALGDPHSAWGANDRGVNVLLLRLCDLHRAQGGEGAGPPRSAAAWLSAADELVGTLRASAALRRGPTVVLLPPPGENTPADADADAQRAGRRRLADGLRAVGGSLRLVDEATLLAQLGALPSGYHSPFLDLVAHAPYSPPACSVLAGALTRELALAVAPKRKAYLLDCDNTLWGGAVGELGAHGVELSAPFLAVQRRFVELQRRGALLCLVSRNEEADVLSVLRLRRDEMQLREEHIVALRANWKPKSANVLELAATLCLDPASFVFVDDSPAECAEVEAHCAAAGVAVVQVPRQPDAIVEFMRESWALDEAPSKGSAPTDEDLARTSLYRELDQRKQFLGAQQQLLGATTATAAAASMDAFVASLNLRVMLRPLDAQSAERAAQLTERTNQHNACKWVTSGPRLLACARSGCGCLSADASDRFGHHGLVGLIVIDQTSSEAPTTTSSAPAAYAAAACLNAAGSGERPVLHIRCWLLSCRSLHLGIEHMMLRHAAELAKSAGASTLAVHWRRAERNEPAAAFLFSLPGVQFVPVEDAETLGIGPIEACALAQSADDMADPSSVGVVCEAAVDVGASHPSACGEGLAATARAGGEEDAAIAAERAVLGAVEAGLVPRLSDLPAQEACARLSTAQRKALSRRLAGRASCCRHGAFASAAARAEVRLMIRGRIGGELCRHAVASEPCTRPGCPFVHPAGATVAPAPPGRGASAAVGSTARRPRDPTYGAISQYKRTLERPEAGLILIPVEAAARAAVSFGGSVPAAAAPTAEARPDATPLGGGADQQQTRAGYESSAGIAMHASTYHRLATLLSESAVELHQWVAEEASRFQQLPEAYREVWQLYERGQHARLESGGEASAEGAADTQDDGLGGLDAETLQARLRRRMRHSMHVMLQQDNPESYYKDVAHVVPS